MQHAKGQVWDVFALGKALEAAQQAAYGEFLRIPAMSMGVYRLSAGGVDPQQPHNEDEAYYVVNGRAEIEIEGQRQPVGPGSVIFVAAHADHRFVNIGSDLLVVVFFAPAET
jgi:quercetin dioxygenase-like cupin family protein